MSDVGTIIRSTNEYVIRMKKDDGELRLFVHRVVDGAEQRPRGYWAGSSFLAFTLVSVATPSSSVCSDVGMGIPLRRDGG